MLNTSVVCFLASYACAFGCELSQLKWRHALTRITALLFAAAGLVAQTHYLLNRSFRSGNLPPLLSSAHDWLLVLAWVVVLVYLFVALVDSRLATGLIIWPLVLLLVSAAQFVSASPRQQWDHHRGWIMFHVSTLALGTAGVMLGLVLSLLYLWQHRRLKHRQASNNGVRLPNLELIERLNRWAILVAVPLQTLGIVSGFGLSVFSKGIDLQTTWVDPIVIGGALTWVLMGVLFVWLLTQKRSPGRQIALLTAWSCGFLIVTFIGLDILTSAIGMRHGTAAPGQQVIE
jgi:ABC-type uncharacterized transport system permease subunit